MFNASVNPNTFVLSELPPLTKRKIMIVCIDIMKKYKDSKINNCEDLIVKYKKVLKNIVNIKNLT